MSLSNETKFLICCAQNHISEKNLERIRNFVQDLLNWDEVMKASSWHRITPLLYHHLKNISEEQLIPQEVMNNLKKAYYSNKLRNVVFYDELKRVVSLFNEKNIDVIVLKGAALAETVYDDIGLRVFADLDILIKTDSLELAEKIMADSGYLPYGTERVQEIHRRKMHHLSQYTHPERLITVEIHGHVVNPPYGIDIDNLWARSTASEISGCKVFLLSPEDMILYYCLHVVAHSPDYIPLAGLCDISETIRYYNVNWEPFMQRVQAYGVGRGVYPVLYLVKKLRENHAQGLH